MAPVTTRAVLLRGHDFGDSSRILRFYTEGHGLLSVVARGVRGRSGKGVTVVSTYASGELTAYVKPGRDLHTMKDFACSRLRERLGGDVLRFAGAAAAAELVLAHVEQQGQPGLFEALEAALDAMCSAGSAELPGTILAGLWTITEGFGFAPQLDGCVRCARALDQDEIARFDFAAGGVRCSSCAEGAAGPRMGPVARHQVEQLVKGSVPAGLTHARQLLALVSEFVGYHGVVRPLRSLRFLGSLLPADDVEAPVG